MCIRDRARSARFIVRLRSEVQGERLELRHCSVHRPSRSLRPRPFPVVGKYGYRCPRFPMASIRGEPTSLCRCPTLFQSGCDLEGERDAFPIPSTERRDGLESPCGVVIRRLVLDENSLLLAASSPGGLPVSYTHLDVYKRQEQTLWLGTTNWERGMFMASRNVDVVLRRVAIAKQAHGVFSRLWNSAYSCLLT